MGVMNTIVIGASVVALGGIGENVRINNKEVEHINYEQIAKEVEKIKKEVVHEVEDEIELVKEIEEIEIIEDVDIFNQDDIYGMRENEDESYEIPLRATVIDYESELYTFMSDGQGTVFLLETELKDGKNYMGIVDRKTNTIIDYKESDFKFDDEWYFENYKQDEVEYGTMMIESLLEDIK